MDKQSTCERKQWRNRLARSGHGRSTQQKAVHIMRALLWCFGLMMLFAGTVQARAPHAATVEVLVKSSSSWNGDLLPEYPDGRPEVTILRIAIPPGVRLPLHMHPVINAGIMTKGKLTVMTADGQVLHLRTGDPVVEVVDTWHYGKNESGEVAEIVVFYAGIQGKPITVKATVEKQDSQ